MELHKRALVFIYFSLAFIFSAAIYLGCSNPYVSPNTSKAISQEKQIELLKEQNKLLEQQNLQLKRIADAIDTKK